MFFLRRLYDKVSKKFPLIIQIRGWIQDVTGIHWRASRYQYLDEYVQKIKPKNILEIGTWDGRNAMSMIKKALLFQDQVDYYGFDLFEDFFNNDFNDEFSISKAPPRKSVVKKRLEKTGANIHLFQGDTRIILPEKIPELPCMDFIFIDGGHSVETIRSDWEAVKKLMHQDTIVLFDDYWNRDDAGCKRIIDEMNKSEYQIEILPVQDTFRKEWGRLKINFVKVSKRS